MANTGTIVASNDIIRLSVIYNLDGIRFLDATTKSSYMFQMYIA